MVSLTAALVLQGVLVAYRGGAEIGRESYVDDGKVLRSELTVMGRSATVALARAPRKVEVEVGGRKVERSIPAGTIAVENGSWQAYALVAEQYPSAARPTRVKLLLPSTGAVVDANLKVEPKADGRRVEVAVGAVVVEVDLNRSGQVVRARVPVQGLVVVPEGEKPDARAAASPGEGHPPVGVVEEEVVVVSKGAKLRGSLWRPASPPKPARLPLAVIVAGSGPTDREGNATVGLRSDCYRMLAAGLAKQGIATLRYDKRGVGGSELGVARDQLTVDDFVADLAGFVAWARRRPDLGPITVVGHSEGGLLSLLLPATAKPDALVLLATAGRPLAAVLRSQLASQLPAAKMAEVDRLIAAARDGRSLGAVPPELTPIFRPEVLRFLRSELWLDPATLLRGLSPKVPVAIVQGETDIQVTVADARLLQAARPNARLVLLPGVNHVLKDEPEATPTQVSYRDPSRPLGPGLLDAVAGGVRR